MVIISGNRKPSCPAGQDGTPSTDDDFKIPLIENEGAEVHEVVGSGSCFPHGEDEPSSMESPEAIDEVAANS
jgi:hypothetical protein